LGGFHALRFSKSFSETLGSFDFSIALSGGLLSLVADSGFSTFFDLSTPFSAGFGGTTRSGRATGFSRSTGFAGTARSGLATGFSGWPGFPRVLISLC